MNNQFKTISILALLCSILVLSSSYIYHLQNWLVFNAEKSSKSYKNNMLQSQFGVGIRSIVSNNAEQRPLSDELLTNISSGQPLAKPTANILTPNEGDEAKTVITRLSDTLGMNLESGVNQDNLVNVNKSKPTIVEIGDEILVEFSSDYSKYETQKVLSRLLVVPENLNVTQILSSNPIDTAKQPALYKKVLDHNKKPIRYPAQAYRYAEYLMQNESEVIHDEQGVFLLVKIPLNTIKLPEKVRKYQAWVNLYAEKYNVEPSLIFAIMDVESAFNPIAVSKSNALGLMQIKSDSAGKDVYQYIDGVRHQPSRSVLFNAKENIRIGSAYLALLKNKYLKKITDKNKKEMLMVSAYNGGLNKVLKAFDKNEQEAINKINRYSENYVYRKLTRGDLSLETRQYLHKVKKAKKKYAEILDLTVRS